MADATLSFNSQYIAFRKCIVTADIALSIFVIWLLLFVCQERSVPFWTLVASMTVCFNGAGLLHHSKMQIVASIELQKYASLQSTRVIVFGVEWSSYSLYLIARYCFYLDLLWNALLQFFVSLIVFMLYLWLHSVEKDTIVYRFERRREISESR